MGNFKKIFRRLPDPRAENARHDLLEILFIALAAVLCGADVVHGDGGVWTLEGRAVAAVSAPGAWDSEPRHLQPHLPSAQAGSFEAAFRRFMAAFAKANGLNLTGVVAVDGKALRGAYERGRQRDASADGQRLCGGSAHGSGSAARRLAATRLREHWKCWSCCRLEGCIVTADALHCHRAFAAAVLERGGDYVLAIKANRGPLFRAGRAAVCPIRQAQQPPSRSNRPRHDRREAATRDGHAQDQLWLPSIAFPGVVAVGRITSRRRLRGQRADPPVVRYYLLSKYMSRQAPAADRAQSLGHREPAPLGARCSLRRGRQPGTKGQCSREPRHLAQARPQHPPSPSRIAPPCAAKSSAQDGTTPSSWPRSVICG